MQPISDAIVELFVLDRPDSGNIPDHDPVNETLTTPGGRYSICLPPPSGSGGATPPEGDPFEVRARKTGYVTASHSFRFVYSVWGYGGVEVSLELVRD